MASTLLADVAPVLARMFDLRIRNQINRSSILLEWLPKKSYAGKAIDWRIQGDGRTVANFASGAASPGGTFDERKTATLSWGRAHTEIEIAFDSLIIAMQAPNVEDAIVDLFEEDMKQAGRAIGKKINAELYTSTGASNDAVGLGAAIAAGAYAGITETYWESAVQDLATGSLVQADMITFDELIFNKFGRPLDGTKGDIYLTTPDGYSNFQTDIGAVAGTRQIIDAGNRSGMLSVGGTGLDFNGVPIVRDVDCILDQVYGLRRDSIKLRFLPVIMVNGMPVQQDRQLVTGTLNEEEPTEMMIHVNELGRVGAAAKFQVWIQYQLEVTDRYAHGVHEWTSP